VGTVDGGGGVEKGEGLAPIYTDGTDFLDFNQTA
jgi:hypothetical protein